MEGLPLRNMHISANSMSPGSPQRKKLQPPYQRSIYRAPQASVRRGKAVETHKAGQTRRRRREGNTTEAPPPPALPPPPLEVESCTIWADNVPDDLNLSGSDRYHKSPPQHYRKRTLVLPQRAHEDFSETYGEGCDGDSYTANTFYSTDHYYPTHPLKHRRNMHKWYQAALQFLVLVVLAVLIYDSHSRVRRHKVQLMQYDEEKVSFSERLLSSPPLGTSSLSLNVSILLFLRK